MNYQLNLREVTYSLSTALDFVGIDDTFHGKRVAYMAAEILKELHWPQEKIDDVICASMLHDCGVSSTDVHSHLVTELDWDNSQVHAKRGEELLKSVDIYEKYATLIRYHHTHWNRMPDSLSEEEKYITNLIYMVDRVDALNAQQKDSEVFSIQTIQETIQKYSGSMFSPELVEIFLHVSQRSSFWFYFEEDALDEYFVEWIEKGIEHTFSFAEVKKLALMFAAVVDAKSEFTSSHSVSVSNLARYLAEEMNLSLEVCEKIEIAGLLHDLGKLRVDDAILNKPAKLDYNERLKMNRHGFDSYIILRRVQGFKEIAYLASMHHETLDSQGYPYNFEAKDIPIEARIITTADIYQALIQNRPYREGLTKEEALKIVTSMTEAGKLDYRITDLMANNLDICYEKAMIEYEI
ncbi:HD-GYP domain-containing protein [Sulfurimonas marina]|uniref:HD domain-containing protein n=1 Tax=Sulfurimonas marina TaxID=2590551 RepID=A0A7M1AVQ8_9BACT|nr:HD domain-containing phosphohydrolase [Sulfurimonas marina]QOP41551.1 HD domain-containing protein [Sulfurimonas marina]